ncbi:pilus assembly protein [Xanthomonas tesorieronis]|uniref:pilus assembly protein n=1 Tax=Xanthomonas tesorieronis TaxID=3160839 RepID=UPI003513F68D
MSHFHDERLRRHSALASLKVSAVAFACTMIALPASAGIVVPSYPLQSGGRIAPNVLFILDDSGSMEGTAMPDVVPQTTVDGTNFNISNSAYTRNTIYYNPAVDYEPWVDATGASMTGGMDYTSVYNDTHDLTSNVDLSTAVRQFFVPKDLSNTTETYLSNTANYYRYQIRTDGTIIRSELLNNVLNQQGLANQGCSNSANGWQWKNCTRATPTGRSEAAERTNFATWWSYSRTRIKVAKGSAGHAFSDLGTNVRVGFRTIWRRENTGNAITQAKPIPVDQNDGLFDNPNGINGSNNNRKLWYDRLYAAYGSGATPLHGALNDAGLYFSSTSATGPYGPQSGAAQLACRQNFTILTTDGYWNGKDNYPSSAGGGIAGEQDNAAGSVISGPTGNTYTYAPVRPYASPDSDTLADVAMRYWKSDLRTDLPNSVPTNSSDPAFWQHMTTFAISIGAKGTLDPATDLPAITSGAKNWPTPINNTIYNIDDLWHAAVNGRGSFIVASNPNEFTQGLKSALGSIVERTGTAGNLAANSSSLTSSTHVYQASFVSGTWTGALKAIPVTSTGVDATNPSWVASLPSTGRNIRTWNGTTGASFPTSAQQTALTRAATSTAAAVTGANNAAYIAGTQDLELNRPNGYLRTRSTLIGDIVNSSPAYDSASGTIFVGSNDGMMHAFNASTGVERFAYVPGSLNFTDLATLSASDYDHRFFVDGPISLSRSDQLSSQTILVGTLGRGGKGIYALDVTTPDSFSNSNVLWEKVGDNQVSTTADNNMGLNLGAPVIAKLNNGELGVIVANGPNSTNEHAVLFVYRLSDGALLSEIDTGVGSSTSPNGLFAPAVRDIDGNGTIDYVYAGDMQGNLWRFNLSAATPSSWNTASNRLRMFTATNSAGTAQPITSAPAIARDPATFSLWIFFGTGRFLTTDDVTNTTVQTVYGIKDSTTTVAKSDLQRRKFAASGVVNNQNVRVMEANSALGAGKKGWYLDLIDPPVADPAPATASGERVYTGVNVISGVLTFTSNIPDDDPCLPGGKGQDNAIDAFTGSSLGQSFFDLNQDGSYADETLTVNGVTIPVASVALGGLGSASNYFTGGSGGSGGLACLNINDGSAVCKKIREIRKVGRVQWREVIQE